jgi:hypothetical protein
VEHPICSIPLQVFRPRRCPSNLILNLHHGREKGGIYDWEHGCASVVMLILAKNRHNTHRPAGQHPIGVLSAMVYLRSFTPF